MSGIVRDVTVGRTVTTAELFPNQERTPLSDLIARMAQAAATADQTFSPTRAASFAHATWFNDVDSIKKMSDQKVVAALGCLNSRGVPFTQLICFGREMGYHLSKEPFSGILRVKKI